MGNTSRGCDIYARVFYAPALIFPRFLKKVVLVNVDGLEAARPKFSPLIRFFYRSFEKMVTKVASTVIVDSKTIGFYYKENYRIKTAYIPNGGGCNRDVEPVDSSVLKNFGLERGEYYLFIARLTPDNSIDLIVEAFGKSNSRKKLVVVGPLVKSVFVQKLIDNHDERVLFLGGIYEPRLQRALRYNCFAYIHGHRMGGTSVSLIEAMSCGNAILAMDTASNREVAENSAVYFKRDVEDLRGKIENLEKTNSSIPVNESAILLCKKNYSGDKILKDFIELVFCSTGFS